MIISSIPKLVFDLSESVWPGSFSRFGVPFSSPVREGYLRLAFHGWHSEADVDRVLEWLEAVSL